MSGQRPSGGPRRSTVVLVHNHLASSGTLPTLYHKEHGSREGRPQLPPAAQPMTSHRRSEAVSTLQPSDSFRNRGTEARSILTETLQDAENSLLNLVQDRGGTGLKRVWSRGSLRPEIRQQLLQGHTRVQKTDCVETRSLTAEAQGSGKGHLLAAPKEGYTSSSGGTMAVVPVRPSLSSSSSSSAKNPRSEFSGELSVRSSAMIEMDSSSNLESNRGITPPSEEVKDPLSLKPVEQRRGASVPEHSATSQNRTDSPSSFAIDKATIVPGGPAPAEYRTDQSGERVSFLPSPPKTDTFHPATQRRNVNSTYPTLSRPIEGAHSTSTFKEHAIGGDDPPHNLSTDGGLTQSLISILEKVLRDIRRVVENTDKASRGSVNLESVGDPLAQRESTPAEPAGLEPTTSDSIARSSQSSQDSFGAGGGGGAGGQSSLSSMNKASKRRDHAESSGSSSSQGSRQGDKKAKPPLEEKLLSGHGFGPLPVYQIPATAASVEGGSGTRPRLSLVAANVYSVRTLCATDSTLFRAVNLTNIPQLPLEKALGVAAPARTEAVLDREPQVLVNPATFSTSERGKTALSDSAECKRPTGVQLHSSASERDFEGSGNDGPVARQPPPRVTSGFGRSWPQQAPGFQLLSRNTSEVESGSGGESGSGVEAEVPVAQLQGTVIVDDSGSAVLCQFEILAELGKGNFGKVSLVMDADGELFALKTLYAGAARAGALARLSTVAPSESSSRSSDSPVSPPPRGRGITSETAAVEREIAVMKRLNHSNVVKLHAVIEDPEEGQTHLVMQYVDNGPIGKVARDNTCRPLPFTLALKYMAQVARGLEYLHLQNIIHRDIKPENILIGSDDTAYLSDFGVSSILCEDMPRRAAGTMSFFSPELLATPSGLEQYGKESDVWAFGVTLYCLLFGKLPFTGHTGPALMRAILMEDLLIPDDFPEIKPDTTAKSELMPDACPFMCRHLDDLKELEGSGPIKVPMELKELLCGLLCREPAERMTLSKFRRSKCVRKADRKYGLATRLPADALGALVGNAPITSSEPNEEVTTFLGAVASDAEHSSTSPSRSNSTKIGPSVDAVISGDGFPLELPCSSLASPSTAAQSTTSTDILGGLQSLPSSDPIEGLPLDPLSRSDIEQAITHCNVVIVRRRGGSGAAPAGERPFHQQLLTPTQLLDMSFPRPDPAPPAASLFHPPRLRSEDATHLGSTRGVSTPLDDAATPLPVPSPFVQRIRQLHTEQQ